MATKLAQLKKNLAGGGKEFLSDDDQAALLEVLKTYKDKMDRGKDDRAQFSVTTTCPPMEVDGEMQQLAPCVLGSGTCPPEREFGPGGKYGGETYSKTFAYDGRNVSRCIPKRLLNMGRPAARYTPPRGPQSEGQQLFRLLNAVQMIEKEVEKTSNGVLQPRPQDYMRSKGHIRATECEQATTRDHCELLQTSQQEGGKYDERCAWNAQQEQCAPRRPGYAVYRPLTSEDARRIRKGGDTVKLALYKFDLDGGRWKKMKTGVGATVKGDPTFETKSKFDTDRRVEEGSGFHSIGISMLRAAKMQGEGKGHIDNFKLMRMWDALAGRKSIPSLLKDDKTIVVFDKDTDPKLKTDKYVIRHLASKFAYGNRSAKEEGVKTAFKRQDLVHYVFAEDVKVLKAGSHYGSVPMLWKLMLRLLLRHWYGNPLPVRFLPKEVRNDIMSNLLHHVSAFKYLPSLADVAGVSDWPNKSKDGPPAEWAQVGPKPPEDRKTLLNEYGGEYSDLATTYKKGQKLENETLKDYQFDPVNRAPGFRYVHVFAKRDEEKRMEYSGDEYGYDYSDHLDVLTCILKTKTVAQAVALCDRAIDQFYRLSPPLRSDQDPKAVEEPQVPPDEASRKRIDHTDADANLYNMGGFDGEL